MKNAVEFESDSFPSYPREDESINPGIWGKRLAEFLVLELDKVGIKTKEFYSEDWGWEIPVANESFPIYIGCSNQMEPGGNHFMITLTPSTPTIRKGLFGKVDTTADVGKVADALDQILRKHTGISSLQWQEH